MKTFFVQFRTQIVYALTASILFTQFFIPSSVRLNQIYADDVLGSGTDTGETLYKEGEVLVKYKEDMVNIEDPDLINSIDILISEIGKERLEVIPDENMVVYKDDSSTTIDLIDEFERNRNVDYVEPNYVFNITSEPADDIGELADPDDTFFDNQWYLDNDNQLGGTSGIDVNIKDAWNITESVNSDFVIAVIDSGVDYTHEDLKNNIWINSGEFPGAKFPGLDSDANSIITLSELIAYGLSDYNTDGEVDLLDLVTVDGANSFLDNTDDDLNGYIDDFIGWDFENDDNNPMDDNSHGTHVAGVIASERNDSNGIAGINNLARIMPIKVFDAAGSGSLGNIIEGLEYTNDNNVLITTNSWGITLSPSIAPSSLSDVIDDARANGSLFIAAAGNGHFNDGVGFNLDDDPLGYSFYPAAYTQDNIISVGSSTTSDERSSFSNYGITSVDIFAPGSSIYSTEDNKTFGYKSGTSMATPVVSGGASLLWNYLINEKGQNPTYLDIKNHIIDHSQEVTNLSGLSVSDSDNVDGKRLEIHSLLPPTLSTSYLPQESSGDVAFGGTVTGTISSNKNGYFDGGLSLQSSYDFEFSENGTQEVGFIDEGGNTDTGTLIVDWILKTSVYTSLSSSVNVTNSSSYELMGGCYDMESVDVTINDGVSTINDFVACTNGKWVSSLDLTGLNDTNLSIDVSQPTNGSIADGAGSVVKDTVRPTDPIITSPADGTTTTSNTVTVVGTTEASAVVTITGGDSTVQGNSDTNGDFSLVVELNSGSVNTLIVSVEDSSGNPALNTDQISVTQTITSSNSSGSSGGGGSSGSSSSNDSTDTTNVTISDDFVTDVEGTTFETYINNLLDENIVSGYGDGTYRPDEFVTRAQLSKFIVNGFNIPLLTSGENFPDVEEESSLADFVLTLKVNGIVGGYSDGTFRPDGLVTRAEVTKFIVNALNHKGIATSLDSSPQMFSDVNDANPFREFIEFLANQNVNGETIIGGYPDGTYKPDENLTRGQMSKIVWNSVVYSREV